MTKNPHDGITLLQVNTLPLSLLPTDCTTNHSFSLLNCRLLNLWQLLHSTAGQTLSQRPSIRMVPGILKKAAYFLV